MSDATQSHARRNALTGEWVLVSPHRLQRPWQGETQDAEDETLPGYDPACYLCPGNERANGEINPDYTGAFAFDNDFPALSEPGGNDAPAHDLLRARNESGCCRVLCYTERHDLRLATMNPAERFNALDAMLAEFRRLDRRDDIAYVQVFENRGTMMGCSNPHPHAQVWATSGLPNEPAKELSEQLDYWRQHGAVLLDDYLRAELETGARVVRVTEHVATVVPFWATWPFEVLILPRRVVESPDDLAAEERQSLAQQLGEILADYEKLFGCAAPYSMGLHPRPSDGQPHPEWQFHIHVFPPLLRSASIRKHMVGFEMLGMPQRDLTPEAAAERLRQAGGKRDE